MTYKRVSFHFLDIIAQWSISKNERLRKFVFFVWALVSADFVCLGVLYSFGVVLLVHNCHTVSYVYVKQID